MKIKDKEILFFFRKEGREEQFFVRQDADGTFRCTRDEFSFEMRFGSPRTGAEGLTEYGFCGRWYSFDNGGKCGNYRYAEQKLLFFQFEGFDNQESHLIYLYTIMYMLKNL